MIYTWEEVGEMVEKLPGSDGTLELDFDRRTVSITRRRTRAARKSGLEDVSFPMSEVTGVELEAPTSTRFGSISFYVRQRKLVSTAGADLTCIQFMEYPAYYRGVMELYRQYPSIALYNRVTPVGQVSPGPDPELPEEEDDQVKALRQWEVTIADPAMRGKVRRIGDLAQRILDAVKENPEKKSQARKFLGYYLPTTLKLLETYGRSDGQPVLAASMRQAREEIEQVMDTLTVAYERQLDSLFTHEALDITTDVRVLEAMLAGDGLTEGPLDKKQG